MGLLDKLKGALGVVSPEEAEFKDTIARTRADHGKVDYIYSVKVEKYQTAIDVKGWPDAKRVDFLIYLIGRIHYQKQRDAGGWNTDAHQEDVFHKGYLQMLMRMRMEMADADMIRLQSAFIGPRKEDHYYYRFWPLGLFVAQIEKQRSGMDLSQELRAMLTDMQGLLGTKEDVARNKDLLKISTRIDAILFRDGQAPTAVQPIIITGDDPFVPEVNGTVQAMSPELRDKWYPILGHAIKASGSKPSDKYLTAARTLIDGPGADVFKQQVMTWFDFVIKLKEKTITHTNVHGGREYTYITTEFLQTQSMDLLKGLVWMCAHFHDARTITTVAALAERSFRKIPQQGPAAMAVGNACLFTLFRSKGLDGIGQLSRLKLRIKQSSTVALIDRYLAEAAADKGITVYEIEDQACDDHGLKDGSRVWDFDGYTATLTVTGPGDSGLEWRKPDGTPQKSVPAAVKEGHAAKLKKLKDTVKQVDLGTTAQRDRLDRMFRSTRTMALPYFREHFVEHGLLGFVTKRIIWNFHDGDRHTAAILVEGTWTTISGEAFTPYDAMLVSLWHPATASVADVRTWREFMMAREIRQPLKQAYREVYLLTDAEVNTGTYSNRMAAHLLKQHQFNSLAKTRGWKYALQGAFDNGQDGSWASISLPDHGIGAQFWLNEVNADGATNDTGIWSYMATDQVRFGRIGHDDPMDLVDVPVVAFSEVMRDVDLFVGVASVGNDPEWQDSGGALPGYRDYWQSYSFGDLGEVAKTRKEILTGLLPRLKIAKVSSIQDKFLVVKGKIRTYKIHLGSTNILMEPNDQYLCIVPDRSKPATQNLFLPFEGDSGLSVIISKAFLLAEDDKITDRTITSQINRK